MFRRKNISGKGVVLNMKINRSTCNPRKKLDELLEEVWEIKKEHPDIKINIWASN